MWVPRAEGTHRCLRPGADTDGEARWRQEDGMKRVIALVLAVVLSISGCSGDDEDEDESGVANPASVYCVEQGGTLDIRTDDSGAQTGYCVFADGTEVEEWAFYRGEAEPAPPSG